MSRIDGYIRALENNTLDDYYEKKKRPLRKLHRYNKGRWMEKGQGRCTGTVSRQHKKVKLRNSK